VGKWRSRFKRRYLVFAETLLLLVHVRRELLWPGKTLAFGFMQAALLT